MSATCNGKNLLSASIREPRKGVWNAVIDVDTDVTFAGSVTIDIDGIQWVGTISKGYMNAGRLHAQIVGGAGKMGSTLDAKSYVGIPMLSVLTDLMNGSGEKLAATTDLAVRTHQVAKWVRPQSKIGPSLEQIASETSSSWRVLRDGTVWLGAETWPVADPTFDEIDQTPGRDSTTIAPATPIVAPGMTFSGRKVSRVVTTLPEGGGLRQELLFEVDGGGSRVTDDITAFIGAQVDNRIAYTRFYPAKVLRQAGDGTLEVLTDDPMMRGTGIARVPIRHGLPGITVKVPVGVRVNLFFEGGDPKFPAAALWPDGSSVTEIRLVSPKVTIDGDLVVTGELKVAGDVTGHADTAPVKLTTHQHPSAMGPTGSPIPGT